jgi:hypothetical protein
MSTTHRWALSSSAGYSQLPVEIATVIVAAHASVEGDSRRKVVRRRVDEDRSAGRLPPGNGHHIVF